MAQRNDLLADAESLMLMMIDRACGDDVDREEFRALRAKLVADPYTKSRVPPAVKVCRDPSSVWSYVKSRDLPSYESRRQHFRAEFEPLLAVLEATAATPIDDLVASVAENLSADGVAETWRRSLDRCVDDPAGAITAARALLESVCKTILDDLGSSIDGHLDLPELYSRVATELKLSPSQHADKAIKRILGGSMNAVNGLGSLRNAVGDSHGQGRRSYKPEARHAALAVNLSGSMAVFLMQTAEPRLPTRIGEGKFELKVGDRVRHRSFGSGHVVVVEPGRVALISFDDNTARKIMYDYAPMLVEH